MEFMGGGYLFCGDGVVCPELDGDSLTVEVVWFVEDAWVHGWSWEADGAFEPDFFSYLEVIFFGDVGDDF